MYCARIDADFISACPEDLLDVGKGTDTASDGQRQKKLVSSPFYQLDNDPPLLF